MLFSVFSTHLCECMNARKIKRDRSYDNQHVCICIKMTAMSPYVLKPKVLIFT